MAEAPPRPRGPRVLILGLPYFGRMLQDLLRARGWNARFVAHPGRDPLAWARLLPELARAELLYLVGSRAEIGSPQDRLLRWRRRPTLIHWVGTDVLIAKEEHARGRISPHVAARPTHWCDAPWLVEPLAAMGIAAEYLPLPVAGLAAEAPPLPDAFRVLLYLPVDAFDREVFDMDTLLRLPAAFPDTPFTLIPSPPETLPGPLPANLTARGWVEDMDALYRATTVYVRLTSHDGTSFMALEALSRGRYVIWTHPLPGAIQASGFDAVAAALRALLERHTRGDLPLNVPGIEAVREQFDPRRATVELDRRLRALVKRHRGR